MHSIVKFIQRSELFFHPSLTPPILLACVFICIYKKQLAFYIHKLFWPKLRLPVTCCCSCSCNCYCSCNCDRRCQTL